MQFNSNLIKLFNKTFCKPIHERLLQLHHYTNTFAQYTDAEEKPMNLWTGSKNSRCSIRLGSAFSTEEFNQS